MTRVVQVVVTVALICLITATPARADPVAITTGFLDATHHVDSASGAGTAAIAGSDGFSMTGNVSVGPGQGRLEAFGICRFQPDCQPGYRLSIGAYLAPTDGLTSAVVSFGGVDYTEFGLTSPLNLLIELTGAATLPDFGDFTPRTMTAPFALTGGFGGFGERDLQLTGRGTATLWLRPESSFTIGERGWTVDRLRYDFEPAAPVPEPSTLLLAATGLAAAVRARRRGSFPHGDRGCGK